MGRPKTTTAVAIVVVIAAAVAGYLYWTSDERRIARLLDDVVDAVSQGEGESGVAGLAEITSLTPHLAPEIEIDATSTVWPSFVTPGSWDERCASVRNASRC